MTDASLKPDPNRKGSYYRRIEDIGRALKKLEVDKLPTSTQFVGYYFGCEKLAHGIIGVVNQRPTIDQYSHRASLRLLDIKSAAVAMNLPIAPADLEWLFADHNEQHLLSAVGTMHTSARLLRNRLTHDFGPTNVSHIIEHARALVPKMMGFLGCTPHVLAFIRTNFAQAN